MRARRVIWIPSLFVGTAVATALSTAAGILLYDAEGLLRELRQVLDPESSDSLIGVLGGDTQGLLRASAVLFGVSAVSLVAGLWMGAATRDEETVPSAARGWVALLVALLLGAGFTALWEANDGFKGVAAAQGLGLALTAALPAYFAGGVWARLVGFAESLGAGEGRQVVAGGFAGAVLGSILVWIYLGRPVLAVTAFLGATVLASAGARCQGWIFDRVPQRRLVLTRPGRPELRFEAWHTAVPETKVRLLLEAGRDRAVDPPLAGDWRRAVAGALDTHDPVLFVGAGSWFFPGEDREWRACEPDATVRDLAARGFGWDEVVLSESPIPERPGYTVVAEWSALADSLVHSPPLEELLAALGEAEVERVWIRGPRGGGVPTRLADAARNASFGVARYVGAVPAVAGPPSLAARGDELWCLSRSVESPGSLAGMKEVPFPGAEGGPKDAGAP